MINFLALESSVDENHCYKIQLQCYIALVIEENDCGKNRQFLTLLSPSVLTDNF